MLIVATLYYSSALLMIYTFHPCPVVVDDREGGSIHVCMILILVLVSPFVQ